MERGTRSAFACVILAQAAHSVEEYLARLSDVFRPARFVSSLLSDDLRIGFVIANVSLISFGLWCWAVPVGRDWPAASGLAWFWAALELVNGTVHSGLAITRAGYFPGVLTAPLLLASSAWLARRLSAR